MLPTSAVAVVAGTSLDTSTGGWGGGAVGGGLRLTHHRAESAAVGGIVKSKSAACLFLFFDLLIAKKRVVFRKPRLHYTFARSKVFPYCAVSFNCIMPRDKTKYKMRCCEVACNCLVRSDKWTDHCRKRHAFKFTRLVDIYDRKLSECFEMFSWLLIKDYISRASASRFITGEFLRAKILIANFAILRNA